MKSFRTLLLLVIAFAVLVGCNNGGGTTGDATPLPTTTTATPGNSTCLPEETRAPIQAACEELARRFGEARGDVLLISAEPREWPDSCLGAAASGEACAQIITPGFEVVLGLESQNRQFVYHTDEGTTVRLAAVRLGETNDGDVDLAEPELVVRAEEPVAFDFAPDGRLFFTERQRGEIRSANLSELDGFGELWAEVPTFRGSECGLLGIALDPEFASNGYVYVYVTQPVEGRSAVGKPRIIRYTDSSGMGTNPTLIVDDLPLTKEATCAHVAGNLHFGLDGFLYVSVGNFERPATSADLSVPTGKILRLNKADGSAAPDNPFVIDSAADPRVFAYGLRNPFDFAFDTRNGTIFAPDNGPGNCDELNVIESGQDYGVPLSLETVRGIDSCHGLGGVDPIYLFARPGTQAHDFGSNVAPAGVAFLDNDRYRALGSGLLVCFYVGQSLHWLELAEPDDQKVGRDLTLGVNCLFNVEVGPDGLIYYSNGEGISRIPAQP